MSVSQSSCSAAFWWARKILTSAASESNARPRRHTLAHERMACAGGTTLGFDLGEPRGVVQAAVYDRAGVITTALSIPNSSWPGWKNGASSCLSRGGFPEGWPGEGPRVAEGARRRRLARRRARSDRRHRGPPRRRAAPRSSYQRAHAAALGEGARCSAARGWLARPLGGWCTGFAAGSPSSPGRAAIRLPRLPAWPPSLVWSWHGW